MDEADRREAPPCYSDSIDPRRDRLPPYKASHMFANSQEELAALKEFAETKLYVDPVSNGMLPDIRDYMGMGRLAWGGPMRTASSGYHNTELTPETAEERKRRREAEKEQKRAQSERRGSITDRLKKVIRRSSQDGADGHGGQAEGIVR